MSHELQRVTVAATPKMKTGEFGEAPASWAELPHVVFAGQVPGGPPRSLGTYCHGVAIP